MNKVYGFEGEVKHKYNQAVFNLPCVCVCVCVRACTFNIDKI